MSEQRRSRGLAVAVALGSVLGCGDEPGGDTPTLRPVWTEAGGVGPVVTAGDLVFAVDAAGTLRALDLGGVSRWTASVSGGTAGAPVFDAERVFVVTKAGEVEAFDRRTGTPRWSRALGAAVMAGLALRDGRLFVVSAEGVASALDTGSGELLWTTGLGGSVAVTPGVADAAVLVALFDGRLVRLDPATGATTWESSPDPTYVIGTPLVFGPQLVVPGYEDTVLGLSLDDGTIAWSRDGGNYVVALPVAQDGQVYFGAAHGPIYAVDATDGAPQWVVPDVLYGRQAILLPTTTFLLVVDRGGPVTWIERERGERIGASDLGFAVDGAALADEERILVVAGGGALHGFELR